MKLNGNETDAAQGIECGAHASGLVRGHPWPSPAFGAVAKVPMSICSRVQGSGRPVGRWKRGGVGVPQSSLKVRSLEAALVVLGPEDSSAKTEVAAALTRAKEQATTQVRFNPDAKVAAARDRPPGSRQPLKRLGTSRVPRWMR